MYNIDPPYKPPFDILDFKLMGTQLFDMMHSLKRDVMDFDQ
jgi:hypothetical protein